MSITAKFRFDTTNGFQKAIDASLLDTVLFLQGKIAEITPRDPLRLPQDPSRKVTGNLRRTIEEEGLKKSGKWSYKIGTNVIYAKPLEYGTMYMPSRSFLRKGLNDNHIKASTVFKRTMEYLLK